jgi:hypothetical protein
MPGSSHFRDETTRLIPAPKSAFAQMISTILGEFIHNFSTKG